MILMKLCSLLHLAGVPLCTSFAAEFSENPRVPAQEVLLAAYFDGDSNSGLRLATSSDGFAWNELQLGERFSPRVGDWRIFRDPSIVQTPDGRFHLVWTTGSNGFGYARSTDLIEWEQVRHVPINHGVLAGENAYTWAPELRYDAETEQFTVLVSVARRKWEGAGWRGDFSTWMLQTEDFSELSDPVRFFPESFAIYEIDAAVIQFQDRLFAFFKVEDSDVMTPG